MYARMYFLISGFSAVVLYNSLTGYAGRSQSNGLSANSNASFYLWVSRFVLRQPWVEPWFSELMETTHVSQEYIAHACKD